MCFVAGGMVIVGELCAGKCRSIECATCSDECIRTTSCSFVVRVVGSQYMSLSKAAT